MMETYTRRCGDRLVIVRCDAALESAAQNLLAGIERFAAMEPGLSDGTVIDFGGWTHLTLRAAPDAQDTSAADTPLLVTEPDFDREPHKNWRDEITTSLAVVASQAVWLARLETPSTPARADSVVTWTDAALETGDVFLRRRTPVSDNDSGWHLGARSGGGDVRSGLLYEWLTIRADALAFVALPPGWIVIFENGAPAAIFENETPRWPPA